MDSRSAVCSSAVVIALTAHLVAQGNPPRQGVPKLHGEAMAYDRSADRLVVVGGRTLEGPLDGTWSWDEQGWQPQFDASGTPPHRAGHTMAFNPDTGQLFLFGGMKSQPMTLLCDTWILENGAWREVGAPLCLDGRVRNAALVYDSARRTMLLVSGPAIADDSTPRPTQIWRWSNDRWLLADDSGPRRQGFGAVAYDAARAVLVVPVLYGGPDEGTWEWDGSSWRRAPAPTPSTRQTYSLTFGPRQGTVVLVGGQASSNGPYLDDVWTWDGTTWRPMAPTGGFAGRAGGTLAATRSGDLLYVGGYSTELLGEMWRLDASGWRRIAP